MTGDEASAVQKTIVSVPRGKAPILQGESVPSAVVMRSGWAAKFVLLPHGRRQIVDILLPGDIVTAEELLGQRWTTSLYSLTDIEVCTFESKAFLAEVEKRPAGVMGFVSLCTSHIQRLRDLVAALGRQSAEVRTAGIVMSLQHRLVSLGYATESKMPFPLRQQDLADLLGLTQVHVSRVLRSMRERRIFEIDENCMTILDRNALLRLSQS